MPGQFRQPRARSGRGAGSRAAAVALAGLRLVARRPGRVLASVAALGGLGVFSWNALMKQPAPHPAPLFATAKPVQVEPPRRPEAQVAAPTPPLRGEASAPAKTVDNAAPRSQAQDPIGALIRTGEASPRPAADPKAPSTRVVSAQKALTKLGYGPIEADGVFGAVTRQAVERFEKDRNLPVTGALGSKTARQLAAVSGVQLD
jgi:hypothetical protein